MEDIRKTESCAITHLRAFAIVLILACHFLQGLGNSLAFVLNVGVQIFLCISGFLYGKKQIKTIPWMKKRIVTVYIPYFLFLLIIFPLYYLFCPDEINGLKVAAHLIDIQEYFGGVNGLGHLWYMTAIGICYLITPFLQIVKINNSNSIIYPYLMTLILMANIAFFSAILYYIFLYALAYFMASLSQKNHLLVVFLLFIEFILCSLVSFLLGQKTGLPIMLRCITAITLLVCFVSFFNHYQIEKSGKVCTMLSKYSYYLYLVHVPLILGPFSLLDLLPYTMLNIVLILIMVLSFSVMLYYLSTRAQKMVKAYHG